MQKKLLAPLSLVVSVLVAGGGLAACGDNSAASSTTVVNMGATNYQTLPVTQSTEPAASTLPPMPGQITNQEQSYSVVSGDYMALIASMYGITVAAIAEANGWPDGGAGHKLFPGDVIKIPAGAIVPLPTTTTELTAPPSTNACTNGTHTIVAGETPGTVAKKYGTTIQKLGLANLKTKGYKSFIIGVKINLPC